MRAQDLLSLRFGPGPSPVAAAERVLERIAGLPSNTTPLLHWDPEYLRQAAVESEQRFDEGRGRPLEGLPVAIKDNLVVTGMPTTVGSSNPIAVPATEASFVGRLREAGAIPYAKANMTEYALRGHGRNSHFGDVLAPGAPGYNAGGSSSGSAASVALGLAAFAIGTDTGGSVRIPAAACGVVGYKPAHGHFATDGVVPLSRSCDHIGLFTRNVAELKLVLEGLGESTSATSTEFDLLYPDDEILGPMHPEVVASYRTMRDALGSRHDERLDGDFFDRCFAVYDVVRAREAWLDIGRAKADNLEDLGGEVAEIFKTFSKVGEASYREALDERKRLREYFIELLGEDIMVLPTMQIPAPPVDVWEVELAGERMPLHQAMIRSSLPFSLIGIPAIAVPTLLLGDGLKASLQLVCAPGREYSLLAAATQVESAAAQLIDACAG